MGILSTQLLLALGAVALLLPAAALLVWPRVSGPAVLRAGQRVALVVASQLAAVAFAGALVNDQYAFYVSWHDLLGRPATGGRIEAGNAGPDEPGRLAAGRHGDASGSGETRVEFMVHGAHSGLTEPVDVYLPPGYGDRAHRGLRYPVVEFLAGWHGGPEAWRRAMHLPGSLAREQHAGRVRPFIAVVPTTDVALPRDVECADLPHGVQAETWLTTDVRDFVQSTFRTAPTADSWGLVGYSTGAYCAAKFVIHHPSWYRAAVLMDGYYMAIHDSTTGDLWGSDLALKRANDPVWLLRHGARPQVDLLAFTSKQDSESYPPTLRLLHAAQWPTRTFELVEPTGGHNLRSLSLALPQMLDWLSERLLPPGASIVPVTSPSQTAGPHADAHAPAPTP